jgi:hypothetical protein
MRRVLILLPQCSSTVSDIRLINPFERVMQNYSLTAFYKSYGDVSKHDFAGIDAVIIQRQATPFIIKLAQMLKQLNIPVLFDIDDYLLRIPEFLQSAKENNRNSYLTKELLALADIVTTSTDRLQDALAPFAHDIRVIPNCSDFSEKPGISPLSSSDIHFIYASTDTGYIAILQESLKKFATSTPDKQIHLHVFGPHANQFGQTGWTVVPYSTMPYKQFMSTIRSISGAIALIPLDPSFFSSCKSPVKFIDYTAAGIPVIASNNPPYNDVITQGLTGYLADNTPDSWYMALTALTTQPETRRKIVTNAYQQCSKHYDMDFSADLWFQLICKLPARPSEAQLTNLPSAISRQTFRTITPQKIRKGVRILCQKNISHLFRSIRSSW